MTTAAAFTSVITPTVDTPAAATRDSGLTIMDTTASVSLS